MVQGGGRERANLVSRLATGGLSLTAGPESGGVAGCGGRQSRSSFAIPRVSGRRATTDATEDNPDPTTWVDQRAIKPARSCLATPQRPAMG